MKKAILITTAAGMAGLIFLFCGYYSDNVSQKPSDLLKHPQYEAVFRLCGKFKDGQLNVDVNSIYFQFENTSSKAVGPFFENLNYKLSQQGWEAKQFSKDSWQYSKSFKSESGSAKRSTYSIVVQRDDVGIVTASF